MSLSLDNDCIIQDLAFQLLKPFGPKNFNSISKNYAFSAFVFQDMNTSGNIFKTWQTKFGNLFFQDLVFQVLKCYIFCNTMSPSLDNDCAIQDLAFQVLKLFGVKHFNIIDPCQELCLSWLGLPRHEHKWTWLSRLGRHHSSEILHFSFKTWQYPMSWTVTFLQLHVPKTWQWLPYSRLGFPSLETFG